MTFDATQIVAGQLEALARLAARGEWSTFRDYLGRLEPESQAVFVGLLKERGITIPREEPALTPSHHPTRRANVHTRDPEEDPR